MAAGREMKLDNAMNMVAFVGPRPTRGNRFTEVPAAINGVAVIRHFDANRKGIDYDPISGAGTVKFSRLLDGWTPTDSRGLGKK